MSQYDERVGRRVRVLRQHRDWTLERLSEPMDITKGYLSSLERGVRKWSIELVQQAAIALDVPALAIIDDAAPVDSIELYTSAWHHLTQLPVCQVQALDRMLATMTPLGAILQSQGRPQ